MTVGERIKQVREQKQISQTELATAINVSKQNLYKYENNIITNIPSDKIEAIANFFKISPAYIMGWENKTKQSDNETSLTSHERKVISAYRNKPEMQPAVDKILEIEHEYETVLMAARSKDNKPIGYIEIPKDKLDLFDSVTPVTNEDDI